MRKKIFIALAAAAILLCSFGSCKSPGVSEAGNKTDVINNFRQEFLFDTYAQLTISGRDAVSADNTIIYAFYGLDEAFSLCYEMPAAELPPNGPYAACLEKTLALSDIYGKGVDPRCGALTRLWGISGDTPRVPSEEETARALETISDGAEGMMYDFGAVAKGYACDRAYELLLDTETEYAVISLGSSALMYGKKPGGPFRTGLTDPLNGDGYIGIIETGAAFISTSGGYERFFEADGKRYSHILDITTGRPAETDLASVTVIVPADTAGGGLLSDFLATLIYIGGTEKLDGMLDAEDFKVIAVDENGGVRSSFEGFELDESGGFYYEQKAY